MAERQCGVYWVGSHTEESTVNRDDVRTNSSNVPLNVSCIEPDPEFRDSCLTYGGRSLQDDQGPVYAMTVGAAQFDMPRFLQEVANNALHMPFVKD
ncbi:hypothetical protein P154DRAFT_578296 [Amniculicola lignicola CBS 123094]|uniref:Uncharacterized protein n=1 Tax=Amniculicola lignicola CBS 123094 TaxID=1392246 RepID=A0A6A5W9D6_9PLEO|nr:hypothetical protein P154DRAFT_578296 [Amniculicola lignicola CBS 123094]